MTTRNFENYLLKNPAYVADSKQNRKLIVISDSKGFSLERSRESDTEKNIKFDSRAGRTTHQAVNIVQENIENYLACYNDILIAIFTFTCDFTNKPGRNIVLSDVTVDQIISECNRIQSICESYGSRAKVVFLECPFYSISIWNQIKCGSLRDQFMKDDKILEAKIEELNIRLQCMNEHNGILAPRFSLDLKKARKSNRVYRTQKISYGVLRDGIHPSDILSQYWLRRLVDVVVVNYCFA